MIHKVALIYAYLKNDTSSCIIRSEAYDGLDPSEKSGVSYFLGLTAAKLFCSRFLDTEFLCHLDVYKSFPDPKYRITPTFFYGNKKPDLVGQTGKGDWIVVEAKGRTGGFDAEVIKAAKGEQLSNLRAINSVSPAMRVALLAHFGAGIFQVHLEDPQDLNDDARDLVLPERTTFIKHYYEPLVGLIKQRARQRRRVGNEDYMVVDLEDTQLSLGLEEGIWRHYSGEPTLGSGDETPGNIDQHLNALQLRHEDGAFVGRDGIFVALGEAWKGENMKKEPHERGMQ